MSLVGLGDRQLVKVLQGLSHLLWANVVNWMSRCQSVLLLAQDQLVMEVHIPKMLCYGEAAQAVASVVKISGFARLIQKASCWVLTAQEDVLLQGLLLKHPPLPTQLRLPFFEEGSVEQRQEPGLPEGVAAVHQFIAAALEASLEAHLSADHPSQQGFEIQHVLLAEDDEGSCAAESVAAVGLQTRYSPETALPVLTPEDPAGRALKQFGREDVCERRYGGCTVRTPDIHLPSYVHHKGPIWLLH